MRVLVTGANGMLGSDLLGTDTKHELIGVGRQELDITDAAACVDAVKGFDAVINCAAYTAVDQAESEPDEAYAINAIGAENLAKACKEHGAVLVQISTDYVFDGSADTPYAEDTARAPLGEYGRTKAAGEELALAANPNTVMIRTAWLYSGHGNNFMRTMLRLANERDTVSVVTDQVGQPTSTTEVVRVILAVLDKGVRSGIYHATCAGQASWRDFASEIFALAGHDANRVLPTTSAEFKRPAPRPSYSVLGHDNLAADLEYTPTAWQDALQHEIDRLRSAEPELLAPTCS